MVHRIERDMICAQTDGGRRAGCLHPHRFFCFFMTGKKIFIISAYWKQSDKAPPQEITRAERLRLECLERIAREEYRNEKHQA